jgi:hypothetical protein
MAREGKSQVVGRDYVAGRLGAAKTYIRQAEVTLDFVDDPHRFRVAASSAILAAIAASDAATGHALGRVSRGAHDDAVRLLKQVVGGSPAATKLARMIADKTEVQYLVKTVNERRAHDSVTAAKWLLEFAEGVVRT